MESWIVLGELLASSAKFKTASGLQALCQQLATLCNGDAPQSVKKSKRPLPEEPAIEEAPKKRKKKNAMKEKS